MSPNHSPSWWWLFMCFTWSHLSSEPTIEGTGSCGGREDFHSLKIFFGVDLPWLPCHQRQQYLTQVWHWHQSNTGNRPYHDYTCTLSTSSFIDTCCRRYPWVDISSIVWCDFLFPVNIRLPFAPPSSRRRSDPPRCSCSAPMIKKSSWSAITAWCDSIDHTVWRFFNRTLFVPNKHIRKKTVGYLSHLYKLIRFTRPGTVTTC
jgi:hypothetical protein